MQKWAREHTRLGIPVMFHEEALHGINPGRDGTAYPQAIGLASTWDPDLVRAVNRIAQDHAPHGRGTVGCLDVFPNSRNVIPGRVSLTVDLRAADDATLDGMARALARACGELEQGGAFEVSCKEVVYFAPQPFDAALVQAVRDGAASLGLDSLDIISGAGHDAVYMARVAPTAMIFVPCKDGISHNEIEDARPEHLEAGCNVLLHAMLRCCGRVEAAEEARA